MAMVACNARFLFLSAFLLLCEFDMNSDVTERCAGNMFSWRSGSYLWGYRRNESQHLELTAWNSDSSRLQLPVMEHVKVRLDSALCLACYWSCRFRFRSLYLTVVHVINVCMLVHSQVTIIFVVSVCLFVCAEFFSAMFDPISIKLGHILYVWV